MASAGSKAAGQGGGEYVSPFQVASQVGHCVVHRVCSSLRHLRRTGSGKQHQPVLAVPGTAGSKALDGCMQCGLWPFEGPLPMQMCWYGSAGQW